LRTLQGNIKRCNLPRKKLTEDEENHKNWLEILDYLLDPEVKDVEAEGRDYSGLARLMKQGPSVGETLSILRHNARVALEASPTEWADLSPLFVEVERKIQLRRRETADVKFKGHWEWFIPSAIIFGLSLASIYGVNYKVFQDDWAITAILLFSGIGLITSFSGIPAWLRSQRAYRAIATIDKYLESKRTQGR
jgi:hypothetical protein